VPTKGLSEEGSTRSWREARDSIPGPKRCVVCGRSKGDGGTPLQANHKKPRQGGGTDDVSNLEWRCIQHQTYVGRPRKS
jgi:hypothetical protein